MYTIGRGDGCCRDSLSLQVDWHLVELLLLSMELLTISSLNGLPPGKLWFVAEGDRLLLLLLLLLLLEMGKSGVISVPSMWRWRFGSSGSV